MLRHREETPVRPSRVVIVGASGFVGQAAMRALREQSIETIGLSSREVDLCHPEAISALRTIVQPDDVLIMVSAITPDKGKDIGTFKRNVAMGEHVSACLAQARCAQVIYLSSDAVYADDASLIRETTPTTPTTWHGMMHLVREQLLAQTLRPSGTPLLCLRPCGLYGPEDTHNSYGPNRFLRTARSEGRITLFGGGEERRDHVLVQDLAQLIGECVAHRSEGTLNIATGRSVSFFELAQMVAQLSGGDVSVDQLPRTVPVTHRYFDIAARVRAFPRVRLTPLAEGLAACVQAAGGHADEISMERGAQSPTNGARR